MKRAPREPYTLLIGGWFYYLFSTIILLIFPLMLTQHLTSHPQPWFILVMGFLFSAWAAWGYWQLLAARYVTKRSLLARAEFVRTAVIPKFEGSHEGSEPMLTANFELLNEKDTAILTSFGSQEFRYGDLKYDVYRRVKHSDIKTERRYMSMLEITLSRELPNMLFDSRTNTKRFRYLIDKSQRDHLEGGFDDVFVTYFPQHYEVDARSIIAPDVMSAMLDAAAFDMEIVGNKLYLFGSMVENDAIEAMVRKGLRIRDALADHIPAYRDERLGDVANRQQVAVYGRTLRESPTPYLLAAIGITVFLGCFIGLSVSDKKPLDFEFFLTIIATLLIDAIAIWTYIVLEREKRTAAAAYHRFESGQS